MKKISAAMQSAAAIMLITMPGTMLFLTAIGTVMAFLYLATAIARRLKWRRQIGKIGRITPDYIRHAEQDTAASAWRIWRSN